MCEETLLFTISEVSVELPSSHWLWATLDSRNSSCSCVAAFFIVGASDSLRGLEPSCFISQFYIIIFGSKGALCFTWHPVELLFSLETKCHQPYGAFSFFPSQGTLLKTGHLQKHGRLWYLGSWLTCAGITDLS